MDPRQEDFPAPREGFVLTHFITSRDVARSAAFYRDVLGGQIVLEGEPTAVKVANGWIIINVGGGPTDDKPDVVLEPPPDPHRTSSFLNIRVADIHAAYAEWRRKGAEFLTPPKQHADEIRCYMRDPDGYLIEIGQSTREPSVGQVDMKLEVVAIPVSDVNRAKAFYAGLGWRLDADFSKSDGRVVQFTPPGSRCSVHLGSSITSAAPGSAQSLYLIVSDIQAAREELVKRGVEVSEVFHYAGLDRLDSHARLSGSAPDRRSYGSFVSFRDPDGNGWLVQEITDRLPGRIDPAATTFGSAGDLAGALRRAEAAHGEHEKRTGQRDASWPDWYAAYLVAEQTGAALPS